MLSTVSILYRYHTSLSSPTFLLRYMHRLNDSKFNKSIGTCHCQMLLKKSGVFLIVEAGFYFTHIFWFYSFFPMNMSFLAYNNGILLEYIIVLIRSGYCNGCHYNTDNTYTTCIYMCVCVCVCVMVYTLLMICGFLLDAEWVSMYLV